MRLFIIAAMVVAVLFGADFDWVTNYKEALTIAKKEHKPVMLMITQPNCNMCEYMDEVAFENEELVDYIEYNFIPLKLDRRVANKLGFKDYGTPTFYFLTPSGKTFVPPLQGAAAAKVFLKTIKDIKAKYVAQER